MIRWTSRASTRTCDGMTRRDFLHAGALGALGLTMANLAALRAAGAVKKDHDERSCIMIFNLGAPSSMDLFDPKPANLSGGVGLGIEQIHRAGRAEIEDHDAGALVVIFFHRPRRPQRSQIRHG